MSYKAPPYTLPPGERVTIQVVGREVAVIEADKDFLIATNSGEPEFITAGLQLAPEGGFHNIVMRNPHVDPINVRLGITDGSMKDNRASVSATLPVRDPDDQSSFSDVIAQLAADRDALLAMMQNTDDKRVPLGVLGNSFASGNGTSSPVALVSPGDNTSGVILRGGSLSGVNNAIELYADTVAPISSGDTSKRNIFYVHAAQTKVFDRPFLIPSGVGLFVVAGGVSSVYALHWDVL